MSTQTQPLPYLTYEDRLDAMLDDLDARIETFGAYGSQEDDA
jgi:hypothetical protein